MYDILIKNGKLVDGAGNPWFRTDVAIKGDKIVKIGKIEEETAERIIDATGLFVTPGFIDSHSHSDLTLLVNPYAESFVRQGITTVVNGNCGYSAAPIKGYLREMVLNDMYSLDGYGKISEYKIQVTWSTFSEYFEMLRRKGIAINVCTLAGHNNIRICAMGEAAFSSKDPTEIEFESMKNLLVEALKEGALGLSTGLVYPPGIYAKTSEIVELCKIVAKFGGVYATHIRGQGEQFLEAVEEAITIGRNAGVSVQLSHHSPNPGMWGRTIESLIMIKRAREAGVDVTCDKHGYVYGSTSLSTVLPPWAHEGGTARLIERLKDPKTRERLKKDISGELEWPRVSPAIHAKLGAWENLIIVEAKNKELEGKSIRHIAKMWGVDPFDAVFDILIKEEGRCTIKYPAYSEEDILRVLKDSTSMVSTDARVLAPYGILGKIKEHPKAYGTFPMIIRKFVKDLGVITLEEAIRKMTSFPAHKFGLWNRGCLLPGMFADLVIFNLQELTDTATLEEPTQYPRGVEYVIVNGRIVIEKGEHTRETPGQILIRSS